MFACICHAVPVSEVDAVIDAGACTVEDVGDACGAGTGCGSCIPRLCARLDARLGASALIGERITESVPV
jgi:bacterioferritin-associated ferredoxin